MGKKQRKKKKAIQKRRIAAKQDQIEETGAAEPPVASTATEEAVTAKPPRPFYVWVIFIYFVLNGAYAIFLTVLLISGLVELDSELTASDYLFSALYRTVSALYIAGGITLFLYRKSSYAIFLAATLMLPATHILAAVTTGNWELSTDQLLFYLPELFILVLTTFYARRLVRSGYLR